MNSRINRHKSLKNGYIVKNDKTLGVGWLRVLHLNAGNETGGGMYYLLRTLSVLVEKYPNRFILGVFEKKELFHRAEQHSIPIVYFNIERKFSVSSVVNLIRFIKRENITHVHTHGPRANVLMNLLRHVVTVRWITTVHSDPTVDFLHIGWRQHIYTFLHLRSIKNAHKVISVCRAFYPTLLKNGVDSHKLTAISNGIDFSEETKISDNTKASLREQYGFIEDDFLIVQVARLEHVKGHQYAFQALEKLVTRGLDYVHLILIGSGSLKSQLQMMCKSLQIEKHVHFLGEQSEADVVKFYHLADVTLLTSISESFPYVLLESARARKPVITTDVGDINRLVNRSDLGWLIKPECSYTLAEALEHALIVNRSGKLRTMGERFFNYASQNFSLMKCVHSIYRVYD